MQVSSPLGSQADQRGWWRSSASDHGTSPLLQAVNAADDASQGDAMSTVSAGDIPMAQALCNPATASATEPARLPNPADAAWGQDQTESAEELQFRLSTNHGGRLPTVVEHMEEGMSRPQALADLSKAGWTVDSVLLRCSSHANITRMARISSFPDLGCMPEATLSSAGSPPVPAFPEYPSQQQLADLGSQMSAAFSGLSESTMPGQAGPKTASVLNPHAASFEPGKGDQISFPARSAIPAEEAELVEKAAPSAHVSVPSEVLETGVIMGFAAPLDVSTASEHETQQVLDADVQAASSSDMFTEQAVGTSNGKQDDKADKAVARRLLLKKRVPSFNKSKSCNDLLFDVPRSPTRSPFAPLANFAQ